MLLAYLQGYLRANILADSFSPEIFHNASRLLEFGTRYTSIEAERERQYDGYCEYMTSGEGWDLNEDFDGEVDLLYWNTD